MTKIRGSILQCITYRVLYHYFEYLSYFMLQADKSDL